ncbi:MAG: ankyrin repeat domain-containing protein [Flavobacteriales bacterium]|nr:ankyrin repeat domain-containing protein [Flavobacteriales bacterium]
MMLRRTFLQQGVLATAGLTAGSWVRGARAQQDEGRPPVLPPELVREFVNVGHGQLLPIMQMLAEHPTLLNAAWDWGGGDFEMAIEGAGHIGSVEVAEYLLARGARANIFVLTMLGRTNAVKAMLKANPHWLHAQGAHGLTLLHHAKVGGDPARELLEHLTSLGLKETRLPLY